MVLVLIATRRHFCLWLWLTPSKRNAWVTLFTLLKNSQNPRYLGSLTSEIVLKFYSKFMQRSVCPPNFFCQLLRSFHSTEWFRGPGKQLAMFMGDFAIVGGHPVVSNSRCSRVCGLFVRKIINYRQLGCPVILTGGLMRQGRSSRLFEWRRRTNCFSGARSSAICHRITFVLLLQT